MYMYICIYIYIYIYLLLDDTLSQASSVTSSVNNAGVYEIPARLRTLHNLVIQYASQVSISSINIVYMISALSILFLLSFNLLIF